MNLFITEYDNDTVVGTGHLYRTLDLINYALYKNPYFKYKLVVYNPNNIPIAKKCTDFIIVRTRPELENWLNNNCLGIRTIYFDLISNILNASLLVQFKSISSKTVMITDDDSLPVHDVNHIILTHPVHNKNKLDSKYITGEMIAYVDNQFFRQKKHSFENNNLLIAFGGVDPFNVTELALNVAQYFQNDYKIEILIGSHYKFKDQLEDLAVKLGGVISIHQNIESVIPLFTDIDIAITAGGNTLYELMAMNTPCFTIAQNSKQHERCQALEKNGYIIHLGSKDNINYEKILSANEDSLKNIFNKLNTEYQASTLDVSYSLLKG